MGSRLGARRMGRSGAYVEEELADLRKYLTGVGGVSADVAFKAAQLGLSGRELALKERLGLGELGLRERELSMEDRHFGAQLETEWAKLGLSQQEIDDKKQMFYDQLGQYSQQFNREYSLKETSEMNRHREELSRQGLTQQEIDNQMGQFDQQLAWEKQHYGMALGEEQRQFNENIAFRLQELAQTGQIEYAQLNETIRQFDQNMSRLVALDQFEIYARTRGMDMEWWKIQKDAALKEIELDIQSDAIFGYWDEGFGPEGFTGDKYVWNEKTGTWETTREWDEYMLEHYHKGELDLREWDIRIAAMLATRGLYVPEGEEPGQKNPQQAAYDKCIADGLGVDYCNQVYGPSGLSGPGGPNQPPGFGL